jgi:flagellar biosynthesis/type III secretory pathway M-ring protein FliF/YscJ|tara:strand:- start:363 stop:479 length:117 start_codon:yes stop_codon:yes gene_type:complete
MELWTKAKDTWSGLSKRGKIFFAAIAVIIVLIIWNWII